MMKAATRKIVMGAGDFVAEAFERLPRLWLIHYPADQRDELMGTEAQVRKAMRMRLAADAEDAPVELVDA